MHRILLLREPADESGAAAEQLARSGFPFDVRHVQVEDLVAALLSERWAAAVIPASAHTVDLLTQIRVRAPELPVVVFGEAGETASVVAAMRAGARDFVSQGEPPRLARALDHAVSSIGPAADASEPSSPHRIAFEHASMGIVTVDAETRIVEVNPRFAQIVGYDQEELVGRSILELSHPADRDRGLSMHRALLRGDRHEVAYRRRYLRKDGELVWAHVRLEAIRDEQGRTLHVVGLVEDLTERVAAEEMIALQSLLLDSVGQTVFATDVEGRVTFWNRFAEEQFGWSTDEAIGRDIFELIQPDRSAAERDRTAQRRRERRSWSGETTLRRRDGAALEVWLTDAPIIRNGEVAGFVGVAHDMTEARAREKQLHSFAVQNAAAASLGQLALEGASTGQLFQQATLYGRFLLEADYCEIAEVAPTTYRRSSSSGEIEGLPREQSVSESAAAFAVALGEPLVLEDVDRETPVPVDRLRQYGLRSGVVIPLAVGFNDPWGVIAVYSAQPRHFTTSHVDFLRALGPVLGQAIQSEAGRRALQQSEEDFRTAVEGARDIIFTVAANGTIERLNRAFETITGYAPEEWIGHSYIGLIAPDDRDYAHQIVERILREHTATTSEMTLVGRYGDIRVEIDSFPKVEGGEVTAIFGFARDVTAVRTAEAERQRLTRSLQLLLDSTAEGISTIDMEGRCTMVNRSWMDLLGYRAEQVLGMRLHDLVHRWRPDRSPLPFDECAIGQAVRGRDVVTAADDVFWKSDGSPLPVQFSVAPIVDDGLQIGAVVTFTDTSERRKLESKLAQATRLNSLGRLAATVAHEFNNVLMGISPFVEVLRRQPTPDRVMTAVEQIGRSVQRGKRITEEILRFTNPAEPTRTAVEARRWLDALQIELRNLLPPRITLVTEVAPEGITLHADPVQLHQVLLNLVLNARDAMTDGGSITISVRLPRPGSRYSFGLVERPERYAHLTVADTGTGIAPGTQQQIFEPLFTTKKSGTGLGLPVAHQIVQRHEGEIFVESQPGVGTAFHLFIPLLATGASESRDTASDTSAQRRVRQVLLVEDDTTVAAGLAAMLEADDIHVDVAATGAEALARIAASSPDVVVLDLGLPDMGGIEVYETIAATRPRLPVVFSTGHGDSAGLESYLQTPHVGMLVKPYDTAELHSALEAVFTASRAEG